MQHAVGRLPKELVTEWQSVTVNHQRRKFLSGTHGAAGLLRELKPGALAPEARIMPLDQAANDDVPETETPECTLQWEDTQPASD